MPRGSASSRSCRRGISLLQDWSVLSSTIIMKLVVIILFLCMNNLCPKAVHPCGPAEWAHCHSYCYYIVLSVSWLLLLLLLLFMNDLCPEVVHPWGPAEGAYHYYKIDHYYYPLLSWKCHYYSFCYASIICALRQCILAVLLKGHIIIILMIVDIIHYDLCSGSARVWSRSLPTSGTLFWA